MKKKDKLSTSIIKAGIKRTQFQETSEPIFLTSGFIYKSAEEAEDSFKEKKERFMYSRFGNPTVEILQKRLALIEGSESCWATSSGMAAVFATFMSYLKSGDRLV